MAEPGAAELLRREAARPVHLVGVRPARELCAALAERPVILHGGPPLDGAEPTPAMRGALIGALLFEGAAAGVADAERQLDAGAYELVSCHTVGGVGAMAGAVTASMPVVAVERDGARAFAPLNEGLGRAIRFGDFDDGTIERLRHLATVVGPAIDRALRTIAPIDVIALQAEALRRGDECHNRNVAASAQLTARLAPAIVRANDAVTAAAALEALAGNPHWFLSVSMAAAKAAADAIDGLGVPGVVTAIASNGHGTGIRVSGVPGWFAAPIPPPEVRLFDGAALADVAPPMGDSSIVETIGLGAMAFSAAPGLVRALGWPLDRAREHVEAMAGICLAESDVYELPDRGFSGTPLGISVRRVLDTGVVPAWTTGFSHRLQGRGRVGFGLARVGIEAFAAAGRALDALTQEVSP